MSAQSTMKVPEAAHTIGVRLSIGELAAATGETVKTLRYWTDLGLLEAVRGDNGYRYYRQEMVERTTLICRAQALGFCLREIADIITLRGSGVQPCTEVQGRLAAHLVKVRERLAELRKLEAELEVWLKWAEAHPEPACEDDGCVYLNG